MKNSFAEAGMISDPKSFAVGNRHLTQQQGRVLNVPVFLFDIVFVVACRGSQQVKHTRPVLPIPFLLSCFLYLL